MVNMTFVRVAEVSPGGGQIGATYQSEACQRPFAGQVCKDAPKISDMLESESMAEGIGTRCLHDRVRCCCRRLSSMGSHGLLHCRLNARHSFPSSIGDDAAARLQPSQAVCQRSEPAGNISEKTRAVEARGCIGGGGFEMMERRSQKGRGEAV